MRKAITLAAVGIAALALAGCGNRGFDRSRPDEFAVARQAPLVIPPDFALKPPQPSPGSSPATSRCSRIRASSAARRRTILPS